MAAIGGLVYYALAGRVKTTAIISSTPSATPFPVSDPYSGWKQYKLEHEKLNFKFPSNWSLSVEDTNPDQIGTPKDSIKIKSPNGFSLGIITGVMGLGGACVDECVKDNIDNQVYATLNITKKPLYVISTGYKKGSGIQPSGSTRLALVPDKTCYANVCYGYEGVNTQGMVISHAGYEDNRYIENFAMEKDVNFNTAIKIYSSYSY